MVRYIPRDFVRGVKRHERALSQMSRSSNPQQILRRGNSTLVGGSFGNLSKTLKQMFALILDDKLPLLPGLSGPFIRQMRKAVQSRKPIEQHGSGIFSVLKYIIPMVLPMVLSLFKKKSKK